MRKPGRKLDAILRGLTTEEAIVVARAFSYFSHLANIAEDKHQIQLSRAPPGSASRRIRRPERLPRPAGCSEQAGVAAATLAEALKHSVVSPVLTAHPTEARRKTLLDAENRLRGSWPRANTCAPSASVARMRRS